MITSEIQQGNIFLKRTQYNRGLQNNKIKGDTIYSTYYQKLKYKLKTIALNVTFYDLKPFFHIINLIILVIKSILIIYTYIQLHFQLHIKSTKHLIFSQKLTQWSLAINFILYFSNERIHIKTNFIETPL